WPLGSARSLDHGALHAAGTEFFWPREGLPEELIDILSRLCGFPWQGDVGFRHATLQTLRHGLKGKREGVDIGGNPVREDDDAGEQLQLRSSRCGHLAQNRFNFRQLSEPDRKSTRLNSSHVSISYAVFCLKQKKK